MQLSGQNRTPAAGVLSNLYGLKQFDPSWRSRQPIRPGNTRNAKLGNPTKQIQEILKLQGYNLAADGVMGPITRSAMLAKKAGVKASVWNHKNRPVVEDPHRTNSAKTVNNHFSPKGIKGGAAKIAAQRVAASPNGLAGTAGLGTANSDSNSTVQSLTGMLQNGQVDPKTYANAIVEAKYGPLIAALHRQLTDEQTRSTGKLADIANINQGVVSNIGARAQENAAGGQSALDAIVKSTPSLAGALGLDQGGAAAVNAEGDIGADAMRMINASQGNFDRGLASVEQATGQDLAAQERAGSAATLKDLQAQELDQTAAKGADYQAALQDATQQNVSNMSQYVHDVTGLKSDDFSNKMALLNYKLAASMAPLNRRKAQADLESQLLGNEFTRTKIKQANTPTPTGFKSLGPGDRSSLHESIVNSLRNQDSGLYRLDKNQVPRLINKKGAGIQKVVRSVNAKLRGAGYSINNPAVAKFAMDILRDMGIKPNKAWYGLK